MKTNVIKFLKEYDLLRQKVTYSKIKEIIRSQGFAVKEFTASDSFSDADLNKCIKEHDCFTFVSDESRIVFINRILSDRDKLVCLLHEEGHIYNEHFTGINGVMHVTRTQLEKVANDFSSMALKFSGMLNIPSFYIVIVAVVCFLILFIETVARPVPDTTVIVTQNVNTEQGTTSEATAREASPDDVQTSDVTDEDPAHQTDLSPNEGEVFFTPYGEVYHLFRECRHLKGSETVLSGTIEESGKYRCCKTCLSDSY